MKISRHLYLLFVLVAGTAFAADDSQEQLAQNHLKMMERFVEILGLVDDVASAEEHRAELEKLSLENQMIFQEAETLGLSHEAMMEYLQQNHAERSNAVFGGMFAAMDEMSTVPQYEAIGEHIAEPVTDLSFSTWTSLYFSDEGEDSFEFISEEEFNEAFSEAESSDAE